VAADGTDIQVDPDGGKIVRWAAGHAPTADKHYAETGQEWCLKVDPKGSTDYLIKEATETTQSGTTSTVWTVDGYWREQAEAEIAALGGNETKLNARLSQTETEIDGTKGELSTLLRMRNEEVAEFRQAVKDDREAVVILKQARAELSSFYKKNRIPLAFVADSPKYTVDPDKAPETSWSDGNYGGRKDETVGVLAILDMITEDVEKELGSLRADDAKAEEQYENERGTLQDSLNKQTATKIAIEKELGETQTAAASASENKARKESDQTAETALRSSIDTDCAWVRTHFDSRREKRKNEIDGLIDAKAYLAGAEDGTVI